MRMKRHLVSQSDTQQECLRKQTLQLVRWSFPIDYLIKAILGMATAVAVFLVISSTYPIPNYT